MNVHVNKVLILSGLPGSGKTYYADTLQRKWGHRCMIVSADHYWGKGNPFDVAKLDRAHAYCYRNFLEQVKRRTELVIVDNTNLRAIEIAPYHLGAIAFGYEAEVAVLQCPPEEAFRRQQHAVPAETFERMVSIQAEERPRYPGWWRVIEL